jgi:hypothetical protein
VVVTLAGFAATLEASAPPPEISPSLLGLWWAAKGEWERAHSIVQDDSSLQAAWVHAYLHRLEGDLGNAGYWYRRAGQPVATDGPQAEWERIAAALLAPA